MGIYRNKQYSGQIHGLRMISHVNHIHVTCLSHGLMLNPFSPPSFSKQHGSISHIIQNTNNIGRQRRTVTNQPFAYQLKS